MIKNQEIYEPARPGSPFIAAVFDPDGRVVASQGFSTRAGAEAFLQAFMQEGAGEHGLRLAPDAPGAEPHRR
jgi:hypothetical protein